MWKSSSHIWHMVLVAGIVVGAVWLGAAWSSALLFAALTCAAMLGVLVWFVVSATRAGASRDHHARP
jgi:hypothetical protein